MEPIRLSWRRPPSGPSRQLGHASRLRDVVAAGAGLLMLNPVFDEMEHLEGFASVVAPGLG
jgi:hypothetical protein